MKMRMKVLLTLFVASLALASYDAYSKRSGFSSSSFKSSSRSSSYSFKSSVSRSKPAPVIKAKPKPKKVVAAKPKPKPVTAAKPQVQKQKFDKSQRNTLANKAKVANSQQSFAQQQSKFKKRPTVASSGVQGSTSGASSNKIKVDSSRSSWSNSARNSNQSTYYQRRGRYYDDWETPSYAYAGYSSYGMWDSMALWHMASVGNYGLYYHHYNTPGMIAWRAEANAQARTNADLQRQLNQMDAEIARMKQQGVKVNPDYVPDGVDRDVLLSSELIAQSKPSIRWCTGATDKNYYAIGSLLKRKIQSVNIEIVGPTSGTSHNLQLMDKRECDGGMVQRDGYVVHLNNTGGETKLDYKRVMSPYQEVVHLVCNRATGVTDLTDLKKKKGIELFVGAKGSGSSVTWSNLVAENEAYGKVKVSHANDAQVKSSLATNKNACMLNVSGLNTGFMNNIVSLGKGKLELVDWNDKALNGVVDPDQATVYSSMTLQSSTYKGIQIDDLTGWFDTSTNVATVTADMIINNRWIEENPKAYARLESELSQLVVPIRDMVSVRK